MKSLRMIPLLLLALAASAQEPPVILLNGFDVGAAQGGECVVQPDSTSTFGRLQELLAEDGREVIFFDNCAFGTPLIEEIGARLGETIAELEAEQVDLIGYSMGGLVIRSYLAGKGVADGAFEPPTSTMVRKAIFLATPHFGSSIASLGPDEGQLRQLRLGSRFSWDLATWNQGLDDLRQVDALAVVGSGARDSRGDGVVTIGSGSLLSFVGQTAERTRVIPACHNSLALILCNATLPLAAVSSAEHPTAIAVRSFLADEPDWSEVGVPVTEHPQTGGLADVILELRSAGNAVIENAISVRAELPAGNAVNLAWGAAGLFHAVNLSGASLPVTALTPEDGEIRSSIATATGATRVTAVKAGARIVRVIPSAALIDGLSLAPNSLVSLFGESLTDVEEAVAAELPLPTELGGVSLTLDGEPLGLLYASPGQVNALFPEGVEGLRKLEVDSLLGKHGLNILIEPAAPAIFTLNRLGTGPAAALDAQSFDLITPDTPIAKGRFVALYVTGIGEVEVEVLLGSTTPEVLYAGPAPGFPGLQQINFPVSAEPGEQELRIRAGGRLSNTATLALGPALP